MQKKKIRFCGIWNISANSKKKKTAHAGFAKQAHGSFLQRSSTACRKWPRSIYAPSLLISFSFRGRLDAFILEELKYIQWIRLFSLEFDIP